MIIGLCGFARSGKSTAAEYLEKNHGFKRVNFKDALVAEMKENFPDLLDEIAYAVDMLNQYETGIGESTPTVELFLTKPRLMRALMQNYGTDVRRKDNPNYWAKKWVEKVKQTKGNIVVDDVRFFNELSSLTELDGVLVRVKRPDITTGGTHQSEKEQELFCEDYTIEGVANSHDAIYEQLEELLDNIKKNNV